MLTLSTCLDSGLMGSARSFSKNAALTGPSPWRREQGLKPSERSRKVKDSTWKARIACIGSKLLKSYPFPRPLICLLAKNTKNKTQDELAGLLLCLIPTFPASPPSFHLPSPSPSSVASQSNKRSNHSVPPSKHLP